MSRVSSVLVLVLIALAGGCKFDTSGPNLLARNDIVAHEMVAYPDGPGRRDRGPRDAARSESKPPADANADRRVVDLPPCGPGTCTGCCLNNLCQAPPINNACGSNGGSCEDCTATGKVCSSSGTCIKCSDSNQCSGDTICMNETCAPAYGRTWHIIIYSARIAATQPDSTPWDASTGPDPKAFLYVGGAGPWSTSMKSDELEPVWNQGMDFKLQSTTTVEVEVDDIDSNSADLIGKVSFSPSVPLAILRAGTYMYQATDPKAGLQELTLDFTPK